MAEVKMLTAKDLAEKAGISPSKLRRLLRTEFNRAGKTKVEGNRMEYSFAPDDPIIKQIIERVKGQPAEKSGQERPNRLVNKGGNSNDRQ